MQVHHFLHYVREGSKDITEVTMIVLNKKTKTTKTATIAPSASSHIEQRRVEKILKND